MYRSSPPHNTTNPYNTTAQAQVSREVEAVLSDLVESFVDSALTFGAGMAAQRNSRTVEPQDLAVHLERSWCVPCLVNNISYLQPLAQVGVGPWVSSS